MSQGPSIQGQVVINTKSVDQAITSVKRLETNVTKAFGLGSQSANNFAQTLNKQTSAYSKVASQSDNYRNIIAKAANTVANYEAAVRKSNATDSQKESLIKQSTASLKGFEKAVLAGARSGQSLKNVTTELNVGLGQLKRDLTETTAAEKEKARASKEVESAQVRTEKALSIATQQYDRTASAIRKSTLSETEKAEKLKQLDAAHIKLNSTLNKTESTVRSTSAAQNKYKETLNRLSLATKNTGFSQAGEEAKSYSAEMRNLSSSVVVALGPLSGVASRITALTGLFNRNAASIAIVLASITGLSVLFSKSAQTAMEAEKQMARVNAQLDVMGDTAQVTGTDINAMAHSIAAATLLSAQQVRDASGALLEFGGIGRSQFSSVIKAAQGMSVVFGGNLRGNIKQLGRAIEDPVKGLQRLETQGVKLTSEVKEQITVLSAQGRQMEATNILLKEMTSLQAAAEGEAAGLAGAYDTLSGNMDKLYENLFLASGAADSMKESVDKVAKAVLDFSNSDTGAAIGRMFEKMAGLAGTAFEFMVKHADAVALGLIFMAGTVVPKILTGFKLLAGTISGPLVAGYSVLRAKITGTTTAMAAADAATKKLNATMKANVVVALVSGVVALTSAMWSYKAAKDAALGDGKTVASQMSRQIEQELSLREDLTKADVQGVKESVTARENAIEAQEKLLESSTKTSERLNKYLKQELTLWDDMSKAGMEQYKVLKAIQDGASITEEQYSKLNSEQKKWVDTLITATKSSDKAKEASKELLSQLVAIKESIPGMEASKEMTELDKQLSNISETADDLLGKFLKQEAETKKLNDSLKIASGAYNELQKAMNSGNLNSDQMSLAAEKSAILGRVIAQINTELKALSTTGSKSFDKIIEKMDEAEREFSEFKATLGLEGKEQDMAALGIEMKYVNKDIEKLVTNMDNANRVELSSLLGTGGDTSVNALTEATSAYIRKQKEARIEMQAVNDAGDTLEAHYNSTASSVDQLGRKYLELQHASITATGEMSESVDKWLQKEQEALNRQADRISTTEFTDLDRIEEEYQQRLVLLEELQGREYEQYVEHLDKMKEQAKTAKIFADIGEGAQLASDAVGVAMDAMTVAGKENAKEYQHLAIAQALISQALAVTSVLAEQGTPWYVKVGTAALAGAAAGVQIAQIKSQSFATGGYVSGKGTSTSDSIPANLSDGEYVLKADAVRKLGLRTLERLNNGEVSNFSKGGGVGVTPVGVGTLGGNQNSDSGINVTIVDNSQGSKEYTTEETTGANGERQMKLIIDSVVKDGINRGRYDGEMGQSFGMRRSGKKV